MKALVQWVLHWAQTPVGPWALFAIAFMEASFFPIPPDVLLIALSVLSPEQSFWYATICTAGSVLGGAFGYFIGFKGGRPLVLRFIRREKIRSAERLYQKYDLWAIFIAGFTPIPYKIFTVTAGLFDLHFRRFLVASLFGRAARFYLVATTIFFFDPAIEAYLRRYFNLLSIITVGLIILGFWGAHWLARRAGAKTESSPAPNPSEGKG